ncbi:malonyl-CoA decarboxylase [Porticoccaceae bacterium]|nr:malonyl-CoA decarboxylase [Porticoccaceae bacterium]
MLDRWLGSVTAAGRDLLRSRGWIGSDGKTALSLEELCDQLLSSRGEALGTAIASAVVERCKEFDEQQREAFFTLLLERYGVDHQALDSAIERYQAEPSAKARSQLNSATEAPRQELFRRINMAPDGTQVLVNLRADLLRSLRVRPELNEVDSDLRHLLGSWFNRGFLRLTAIDWKTPAHILEKLIAYEAVHAMNGWSDLRRRLASDRRCFAFFHPAMPDEPLIFVQVALCKGMATSVQTLLEEPIDNSAEAEADTAIFYSISDCQRGLKGVTLGNFLIKQVVLELQRELPNLSQFATLSPIPGFVPWLQENRDLIEESGDDSTAVLALLHALADNSDDSTSLWQALDESGGQQLVGRLAAHYLYRAKRGEQPQDPVARFHLRNGAAIEQVNVAGDTSKKGCAQALGAMVNYRYRLDAVEKNHEAFVAEHVIATEKTFLKQLENRRR